MFAKVYDTEDHGQILVMKDPNEEGCPQVRFFFEPEGLGVCSMDVNFKDTDAGWDEADKIFDETTAEKASEMVAKVKKKTGI